MTMRARDLHYPVLCLPRDMGPFVAADPTALERCAAVVYWRGKLYDGLRLVDPDGNTYTVVRATIRNPASAFGQRLVRFLMLSLTVDVELAPAAPMSLAEVGQIIERAIEEDPEAFEEFSGRDVEWWRRELAKALSVADVLRAFGGKEGGD